jgi:hypothetical protein
MKDFSLGSIDLKKIGTGLLIAEAGAILATAETWLASGKFDWKVLLTLEMAATISVLINTLRKILDGISQ